MDLSSEPLGAIRRSGAVDTVRARIMLAVELGMLAPGQRLPSPEETARAFDVSEMSVRRAYRTLADESLVTRRRGNSGGTFIVDEPHVGDLPEIEAYRADAQHVHDLIDQRAVLEAGLAGLAAHACPAEDLAALTDLVERMRTVPDWAGYRELDAEFHDRIARIPGVAAAALLHHRLSHELYAYFIPYRIDYLRASNEEHARLVDALAAADAALASRLTFEHIVELHESMYVGLGERETRGDSRHPDAPTDAR
ncbi:FadR/GntR family transcriptional regulator [Agromyces indicus]|uniref:FCD domain-containing protein n=1 Tax=Agromyces indicus TaxID=758919 RepID=A0ABU1FH49_9MICO|nr:FCD domain-containing protein [Agromyces indicus]MDR5691079.1 FCD domain-containing protein [Agromyces indicus]